MSSSCAKGSLWSLPWFAEVIACILLGVFRFAGFVAFAGVIAQICWGRLGCWGHCPGLLDSLPGFAGCVQVC